MTNAMIVTGARVVARILAAGVLVVGALTAQAAPMTDRGTWYGTDGTDGTLQPRDLDGNPATTEAWYDTEQDLLWLDLSVRKTWGGGPNGTGGWLASLNESSAGYGLTGWRLPEVDYSGPPAAEGWPECGPTTCGSNVDTWGSEWAHLWYETLGNIGGQPMTNTGPFQNLQSVDYWSGTEYASGSGVAWYFGTGDGYQHGAYQRSTLYALAVRPGDVAATVPQPQSLALALLGLAALWVTGRRRPPRGLGASKA